MINKKTLVTGLFLVGLFSAGGVLAQAMKPWHWKTHRLSFSLPAHFKVKTQTAQLFSANDGRAFTFSLKPSIEGGKNAQDIARAALRKYPAADKKMEGESKADLKNHHAHLIVATGTQKGKKLNIVITGFSSKTTELNVVASYIWWDIPARNDEFIEIARKITMSFGSY